MKFYELSFIEVYDQFFMQGSNLGNKISAKQKGARFTLDTELKAVHVLYKGKASSIPLQSIKSYDYQIVPEELQTYWGISQPDSTPETNVPPAIRRGRKPKEQIEETTTEFDHADETAAALHKAEVRARSANSFKAAPVIQNDALIQQARGQAMGFTTKAQVSNPTMPTEGASVVGKTKALSHAQLRAQLAAEAKDVKPA